MFSTINNSWKVVENIVEKWGFSPSVPKSRRGILMGYFNTNKTYVVGCWFHENYGESRYVVWWDLYNESTWNGNGQIIKKIIDKTIDFG